MTEAEKIRNDVEELLRSGAHEVFSPEAATTDIALILELSWPALAWCRDNKEVVEALARGENEIIPASALRWLHGEEGSFEPPLTARGNYWWRSEFRRRCALVAAPKKPG